MARDWEKRTERKEGKSGGEVESGGKKKRNLVEERESRQSRKCRRVGRRVREQGKQEGR